MIRKSSIIVLLFFYIISILAVLKYFLLIFFIYSATYSMDFEDRTNKGIIEFTELDENSGMVVGIENPELIWAINDGRSNEIYGFGKDGKSVAILNFKKKLLQDNSDIEDIAICKIDGISYIILSDTGDNSQDRSNFYIYLVPEPKAEQIEQEVKIDEADIITIVCKYEDGPRDAECLMADPITHNLFIVTKREKYARLYELDYPFHNNEDRTFMFIQTFEFGNNIDAGYTSVTGGDISKDGKNILIRDYSHVWYFNRSESQSIPEALRSSAQQVKAYSYSMIDEPQGESVCWENNNEGFYTASEEKKITGFDASLFFFKSITSSVKKKENRILVTNNVIVNTYSSAINVKFYNYLGQNLLEIIIPPFGEYNFEDMINKAHYLFIDESDLLYRLGYNGD